MLQQGQSHPVDAEQISRAVAREDEIRGRDVPAPDVSDAVHERLERRGTAGIPSNVVQVIFVVQRFQQTVSHGCEIARKAFPKSPFETIAEKQNPERTRHQQADQQLLKLDPGAVGVDHPIGGLPGEQHRYEDGHEIRKKIEPAEKQVVADEGDGDGEGGEQPWLFRQHADDRVACDDHHGRNHDPAKQQVHRVGDDRDQQHREGGHGSAGQLQNGEDEDQACGRGDEDGEWAESRTPVDECLPGRTDGPEERSDRRRASRGAVGHDRNAQLGGPAGLVVRPISVPAANARSAAATSSSARVFTKTARAS